MLCPRYSQLRRGRSEAPAYMFDVFLVVPWSSRPCSRPPHPTIAEPQTTACCLRREIVQAGRATRLARVAEIKWVGWVGGNSRFRGGTTFWSSPCP